MPRRQKLTSFEDRVAEEWLFEASEIADRLAAEAGPPPGGSKMSERQAIDLYGQADPAADYDQILSSLLTTGIDQETFETLEISRERPEWAEFYLQPTQSSELAAMLAVMAEYPYRAGLVLDHSDDPDEQVRRDATLYHGWQKQIAGSDAPPPPDPPGERLPVAPAPPAIPEIAPPAPVPAQGAARPTASVVAPPPNAPPLMGG